MVNNGLRKHGVVLNLGLPERGAVARDDDELSLTLAERLEGRLVAEGVLARLHDEGKAGVDALLRLLLLGQRGRVRSCTGKYTLRKHDAADVRTMGIDCRESLDHRLNHPPHHGTK